jgi:hypothetical protein
LYSLNIHIGKKTHKDLFFIFIIRIINIIWIRIPTPTQNGIVNKPPTTTEDVAESGL